MGHDRARSAYRKGVAVELRTQGYSYDEIAETLEFKDRSGAWRCVQRALQQRGATATDRYRMVRYAELENLHRALWQAAELGDHDAVLRCLRVAEARTKLLGLV